MRLICKLEFMFRKDLLIWIGPEPFDLFLDIAEIRDIMDAMAGINTIRASLYLPSISRDGRPWPIALQQKLPMPERDPTD